MDNKFISEENTFEPVPQREDIAMIPEMKAAGWKPKFHSSDELFQRLPEFDRVPVHGVGFVKGNINIWLCIRQDRSVWQVAELIDGFYYHHRGKLGATSKEPFKGNRFIDGFIPDLKIVLELDSKNDL